MSEPVFTPATALFPALTPADVAPAAAILRHRVEEMDTNPHVSHLALDQYSLSYLQHHETEALTRALSLYALLVDAVCTPAVAQRLPDQPYPGSHTSRPWHTNALAHLPAAVLLAGDDTVLAALRGGCDPTTLPDPTVERAVQVQMAAVVGVKEWRDRTFTKPKDADRAVDAAFDAFEVWTPGRWPGLDIDNAWRHNLTHDPFVGARMRSKELMSFGRVGCPLTYTTRYPSTVAGADTKWAGSNTKRGSHVQVNRSLWMGTVEGLLGSMHGWLAADLLAVPATAEGTTPLFTAPTAHLASPPVRQVAVWLTSGRGWRQPKSKDRTLPVPGTAYPTGAAVEEMVPVRTEVTGPDITITIPLPAAALPSAEDTVAAIMRIVSAQLLTHTPGLTDHARTVLTAWRDAGPEPWGPRPITSFENFVDLAVAHVHDLGVQWEQPPPGRVLNPTN